MCPNTSSQALVNLCVDSSGRRRLAERRPEPSRAAEPVLARGYYVIQIFGLWSLLVPLPSIAPFLSSPTHSCRDRLRIYPISPTGTTQDDQHVDERTKGDRSGAQGIGLPRHRPLQNSAQDSYRPFSVHAVRDDLVFTLRCRSSTRTSRSAGSGTSTCARSNSPRTRSMKSLVLS